MTQSEIMVRASHLYHKRRERFFRIIDAGAKFLSIVALTALATVDGWIGITIALVSGAATILSIVLDFPAMATKHETLSSEYLGLLADMTAGDVTDQQADHKRREIGVKEPAVLRGLAQLCTDEVEAAIGCNVPVERLSSWRRFRAHLGFGEMPIDWTPRADTH